MGLFDRLKAVSATVTRTSSTSPSAGQTKANAVLYDGHDDLEVVGEAHYEEALWGLCGGRTPDRVRHQITAVLVPEPSNPHDRNAISVQVEGQLVGYLSRETAEEYAQGLQRLMQESGGFVALEGIIVGGGTRADGPGRLGIWLKHDPADFGVSPISARESGASAERGGGLAWLDSLPHADRAAIDVLRGLLGETTDPIDRHFLFAELEKRLYRCRDLYAAALDEFDEACAQHDREMDVISDTFQGEWNGVPRLETYHQMAIRRQKQKDWDGCLQWIERGLALYSGRAIREDAVEDLLKRRNRALAKLGRL